MARVAAVAALVLATTLSAAAQGAGRVASAVRSSAATLGSLQRALYTEVRLTPRAAPRALSFTPLCSQLRSSPAGSARAAAAEAQVNFCGAVARTSGATDTWGAPAGVHMQPSWVDALLDKQPCVYDFPGLGAAVAPASLPADKVVRVKICTG